MDEQPNHALEGEAEAVEADEQPKRVPTWAMVAGELAFAVIAVPLYIWLVLPLYPEGALPGISPLIGADADPALSALASLGVFAVGVAAIFVLPWVFGAERFLVDEIDQLLRDYNTLELAMIYAAAGIGEELLFRVVCVDAFGLVISSAVFTAVHAAYWKKPFMLADVFLLGLLLGALYLYTHSLLLCALVHAVYNLALSILMREGIVPIERKRAA